MDSQVLEEALQAQYASATEASQEELRIASAAELFAAIGSGHMATRLSVLEAIAQDPQGALGFGPDGNTDLVSVLCGELEAALGMELRLYIIFALAALPSDPRITRALEQVWFLSDDTNERLSAVSRLAREEDPAVRSHLQTALLSDDPDRAQAVANVWWNSGEDSPKVRLRLVLGAEGWNGVAPGLEEYTGLWLHELHGPFAGRAREVLESTAVTAELLGACWEKLDRENRVWLLELATQTQSPYLSQLTNLALREEAMHLGAIQAIHTSSLAHQYFDQLLELAEHSPNPAVQAAAIGAGAPGDNRFRAVKAAVRGVRVAAIRKLGVRDVDALVELIHDPDWRIRSAAADQLVEIGERGKQAVEPLLQHPRLEVRLAAARVIYE